MPTDTGIWEQEEANQYHDFSYRLAQYIGQYLPKNKQVIDLGCGLATYLRYLHDIGFTKLLGVEGTQLTNFEFGNILVHDLSIPIEIDKKGNVICLEVGEHIAKEYEDVVIDNICKLCADDGFIIMSWAIPTQDGIGHVNCQHNIYILDKIAKKGFSLLLDDTLRVRGVVEDRLNYFRNTLMIFKKNDNI
jgi:hypothetical protein